MKKRNLKNQNKMWNRFKNILRSESKIREEEIQIRELYFQEGIRVGMAQNFEKSQELSEKEYNEVIDFLVSRGLELCCYDIRRGGFRIRKRNYNS